MATLPPKILYENGEEGISLLLFYREDKTWKREYCGAIKEDGFLERQN